MSGHSDVQEFSQAQDAFGRLVDRVADHQWASPTPCTEWDVRALVNHLVGEQRWAVPLLAGRTLAEVGSSLDGDLLGDDPKQAWAESAAESRRAFTAPGALDGTVHTSAGEEDRGEYLSQMLCDLIVHRWDLGSAIGEEQRFSDTELAALDRLAKGIQPISDQLVEAGIFAAPLPVAADADEQARVLAAIGRADR